MILLINIIFSYIIMKFGNGSLFYLFVDLVSWFVLYFLYEFLCKKKVTLDKDILSEYVTCYFINFFFLLIFFLFFKMGFLKTKFLAVILIIGLLFVQEKCHKVKLKEWLPYILLFDITIFFGLTNAMSPLGNKNTATDSSVFRYIGTIMTEGKVPYVDVFDHKGIFLYIINYLGVMLNKDIGIWIIEIIMLYFSFLFAYKLARLFANKFNSIIAIMVSFIPLIYTYEGGNLTEGYAILFIVISLYLFTRDLKKFHFIKMRSAFIIGLCLGAILLLRPNMLAVWACMAMYLLIFYLKEKKYQEMFQIIGSFVAGIIVFIIPFMLYLIFNGALEEFINQYLLFNFKYSSKTNTNTLIDTFQFFINHCKYVYFAIIVYLLNMMRDKKNKELMWFYIASILLSFLFIIMPKNFYAHYGMVIIPTFIVAFAIMFEYLYEVGFHFIKNQTLKMGIIVLLVYAVTCIDIDNLIVNIDNKILEYDNLVEVVKVIEENTDRDDKILVYGNNAIVYLKANRRASQKYIYQYPIMDVDRKIKREFQNNINENKPKLIIARKDQSAKMGDTLDNVLDNYSELDIDDYNYYVYKLNNIQE